MGCRSFEEAHERSLSERLTEEPPPWLSPDRTAWAAAETPWLTCWLRFMRLAQSGAPLREAAGAAAKESSLAASSPPTVSSVEEPPVALKPPFTPSEKFDLTLSDARPAARFRGETAAEPAPRATPPRPDAMPEAPVCPIDPRL